MIAVPVGLATAIFISEYAPHKLRRALIALMDLMAAVPSIIVALFALFFLMPRILGFDAWLSHHMAFIPFFVFRLANYPSEYANATFIASVAVSLLVIPIVASLSRQVFSQAPQGEREAAYALGSTRWGMIRTVVLPYGRSGMIGASMLGLGRALGETIVMSFILNPGFVFNYHVLESGGNSITVMIANHFFVAGTKEHLRADGRRPGAVRDDPDRQHVRRDRSSTGRGPALPHRRTDACSLTVPSRPPPPPTFPVTSLPRTAPPTWPPRPRYGSPRSPRKVRPP